MASVTVFVDDAVRGTLPGVCARDGVRTGDSLRRQQEIGNRAGLGVAWLLVLAGPIGWLGLLVIAASKGGRPEQLQVELPMSEPAYQRMRGARRLRDRAVLALVVATLAGLVLLAGGTGPLERVGLLATAGVIAMAFVALVAGSIRFERENIGVALDASRRWVTLSNVHPDFVVACQAHEASHGPRT